MPDYKLEWNGDNFVFVHPADALIRTKKPFPPLILPADTQMKEGSGGKYLSNEIFYRVSLARERWKKNHPGADKFPTGHFHVAWIQIQVFLKLDLNDEYTVYRYKNNGKIDWYAPSIDSGRTIKDELKTLIKTVEDRIKKGIENYNDENDLF